jgi:glutathione S-transferase
MTGEGEGDPANPHPDRRVPAISHDGELVAESVAIVLYLTDAFPGAGLGPAVGTVGRGAYLTWLAWYAAEFEPAMFAAMGGELAQAPLKQRSHDAVSARLETALSRGPWLMGNHFSGVDLLVGSALNFARSAFGPSTLLDDFITRCKARPAALRCVELDDAEGIQMAA